MDSPSLDDDRGKVAAANAAADLVQDGMIVGLGSGSTATLVVQALGRRVASQGLQFSGVATSNATAELARSLQIPLRELDAVASLDLNLDGADEVDPNFQMIKGRGGALLREKIIATAARRRVNVVTPSKRVLRLGAHSPIPLEVSPIGVQHLMRRIQALGAEPNLRHHEDQSIYQTDGGNWILDCIVTQIDDPAVLHARLKQLTGVFETGIFIRLCDVLIVGDANGVEIHEFKP